MLIALHGEIMESTGTPLVKTKLSMPARRSNLVARPRLLERLEGALHKQHRLILISARAGSGKTTLVSEWLRQVIHPAAWLSLDEHDNNPWRFAAYLWEALRILAPALGELPWRADGLPEPETLLPASIDALEAQTSPLVLALDDFHLIHNAWIHDLVASLVERFPPHLTLVLLTRADPPLPLARWRARDQLTEIRDRDLLFTSPEVDQFLNVKMALNLPAEAISAVGKRTEGWIAGLLLAALSLQSRPSVDRDAFLQQFRGTNRYILDYLAEEVLDRQPPAIQRFLVETSILDSLSAELCDALCTPTDGAPESQSILERLEVENLFVTPLDEDRRWYRYHQLFADLLQSVLRGRYSTEQIRDLHRRASQWYQARGMLAQAMPHLMAAGDYKQAADIIEAHITRLFHVLDRRQAPLLLSWIDKLPEAIKNQRPALLVHYATLLALNLQLEPAERILDEVEGRLIRVDSPQPEVVGHLAAARAYTANLRGDPSRSLAMAAQAGQSLAEGGNLAAQAIAAFAAADTWFVQDELESASQALARLLDIGVQSNQPMVIVPALCDLAAIKKTQGHLHQAERLYEHAQRALLDSSGLETRVRCSYEFGIAGLHYERDELEAAYAHAMSGMELRSRLGGYNLIGELAVIPILQARRDRPGAMQAIQDAERAVSRMPFQMALLTELRVRRVLFWLSAGELDMAAHHAQELSRGTEREQIALARLRLAQGQVAEAYALLDHQQRSAEAGNRLGRLIEILGLFSITLEAQGQPSKAEATLDQALFLGWQEGFRRVFLDLGAPLLPILERLARRAASPTSASLALLDACGVSHPLRPGQVPPSPLTNRELEVLQLLAEGRTTREIAGQLTVTPSTVKQHLKNISRKLQAHGRLQIVRRGREMNLLR